MSDAHAEADRFHAYVSRYYGYGIGITLPTRPEVVNESSPSWNDRTAQACLIGDFGIIAHTLPDDLPCTGL